MASVNKVIIVGNLGRDPEMRTFPSGDQVANVTIATTDKWKDKQTGEMKEVTEWHRVVFNGRLAEVVGQYPALLSWAKTAATRLQGPHGVTWRAGAVGNHQLTCQAERNRNDNRTDAPTTVEPL